MELLIVEDNEKMRVMIKKMFGSSFTNIYECEDGSEALQMYMETKPDWVFMDLKMKVKDGITATIEIIKNFPEARILILTDYNDEELRKASILSGAVDYVLKENLEVIHQIINK